MNRCNYHTYKEIITQLDSWETLYEKIAVSESDANIEIFSKDYDEIIFFGCGSSYNAAMSASFFTRELSNFQSIAVPSSELKFNIDNYINKDKKYLLIGFSRSGETTESINMIKTTSSFKNINTFSFTCSKKNTLIGISDDFFICRGVNEKSVVMTKSFSSMLLAYCLLLTKYLNEVDILKDFKMMLDYLNGKVSGLFSSVEEYLNRSDFNTFFALGSGFNYGLAVEADLKMKEMTLIPSYSYHLMEFNHGPKSLISDDSLCLILTPNKYLDYLDFMIEDFSNLGSKIIVIGKNIISKRLQDRIHNIFNSENIKNDLVRSFINIPVFQILAFNKTIRIGLNPDKPKNLEYTTKIG